MDFDEYQMEAYKTAVYPREHRFSYPIVMLASEGGELAGKYSKLLRDRSAHIARILDGNGRDHEEMKLRDDFLLEMGDLLWGLAALSREMGVSLDTVAHMNLNKLSARSEKGTIRGSGDDR